MKKDPFETLREVLAQAGNLAVVVHEYLPPLPKGWTAPTPFDKLRLAVREYDDAIQKLQREGKK